MRWDKIKTAAAGALFAVIVMVGVMSLSPGSESKTADSSSVKPERTQLPTQAFMRQSNRTAAQIEEHYGGKTKNRPRLNWATFNGDVDAVRQFLAASDNVNERSTDNQDLTALNTAATLSRDKGYDIVKLLLDAGADINAQNANGNTPLMAAVRHNSPRTVELLLSQGAKIDVTNVRGQSALDWAKEENNRQVIKLIEDALAKQR